MKHNGPRKYYSHSQMETFSQCGLKYNFKYIQGIDRFSPSSALVFGSAIHKALEEYHKSIIKERLTSRRLMDVFEDAWETAIETSKKEIAFKNKERDNLFEIGLDILAKYHKDNIHMPAPCMFIDAQGELVPAVEIDFMIEIEHPITKISKPINGKIDLITPLTASKTSEILVIDHKTSSEDYTQFKVNNAVQLSLYAYAFRKLLSAGRFPYVTKKKEDAVGYNVFKKMSATKSQPDNYGEIRYIRKQITDADIYHMTCVYGMMDMAVANKIFMPNYGRNCSWCEYNDICTEFKYEKEKE